MLRSRQHEFTRPEVGGGEETNHRGRDHETGGDGSLADSKSQSADEKSSEVGAGSVTHEEDRPAEDVERLEGRNQNESGSNASVLCSLAFVATLQSFCAKIPNESAHHPLSDGKLLKSQVLRPLEDEVGEICEGKEEAGERGESDAALSVVSIEKKRAGRTHRRWYRASCTEG